MRGEAPPDEHLERQSLQEFDSRVALLVKQAREVRRNLLALKRFGIFLSLIVALTATAITISIFLIRDQISAWPLISAVTGWIWLIGWVFEVKENWVRESANHYARALLDAIAAMPSA